MSKQLIKGESGSVDLNVVTAWREDELQDILRRYEAADVYNADETALFWKCLPDRTLCFKGDQIEGRKAPKDRITIMTAANMDGSHKLPLLVLGIHL